ncbi:MAG TPA: cbb3-type cytochrome c oxidase N-terminal domain-containing protein [Opitutaceae bacterium]
MNPPSSIPPTEDSFRPHSYDGIREYDKRLPNWWLYTLYITIVFWIGYWGYYEWLPSGPTGPEEVDAAMARIEAERLASVATMDDATLWTLSRNPAVLAKGKETFTANCVACHYASMRGKAENPIAIGPDLTDNAWIHGGKPIELYNVVTNGVLVKGMPTWGPVLGARKISEVVAYVLSVHNEGDPVVVETPR